MTSQVSLDAELRVDEDERADDLLDEGEEVEGRGEVTLVDGGIQLGLDR